MHGEAKSTDGAPLYACGRKHRSGHKKPALVIRADVKKAIAQIRQADPGQSLSPKMLRDPKGLEELIDKHGPAVVRIITGIMCRLMIDGQKVRSWKYFDEAIVDELRLIHLQAERVRPGDVTGWRALDINA